ncbi:verprolin [Ziziphus jujuba]|uniref:Verprolin n=2 Tax=Ziziphus jujuba TaxID=326968 RepID=A0A6P3ZPN9_ZIZJJ|nr:verprolin [Ziziphus jujuba]KAH7545608.1 hypothetical protein FEM48_Zijuj01G0111500 [Ziziphus jujuba var. spinosa]
MALNLIFMLSLIMAAGNLVDSRILLEKLSNENEQRNGGKLVANNDSDSKANNNKMVENLGDMKDSPPLPNIPLLPPIPGTGTTPSAPPFPFPFPFPVPQFPIPPFPGITPLPPIPTIPTFPLPPLPPIPTIPFLTPPPA